MGSSRFETGKVAETGRNFNTIPKSNSKDTRDNVHIFKHTSCKTGRRPFCEHVTMYTPGGVIVGVTVGRSSEKR